MTGMLSVLTRLLGINANVIRDMSPALKIALSVWTLMSAREGRALRIVTILSVPSIAAVSRGLHCDMIITVAKPTRVSLENSFVFWKR